MITPPAKPAATRPILPPRLSVTLRWPLVDIVNAAFALDRTCDEILFAVEKGDILYAFDLRRRNARHRFVRIWHRSLSAFYMGSSTPVPFQSVLDSIIPTSVQLNTSVLMGAFSASNDHIIQLAKDKLIKTVKAGRTGVGGAAIYDRQSVAAFLTERRML